MKPLVKTVVGYVGFRERRERRGTAAMKVRNSLRSLKQKDGSIVVRRHGQIFVLNKRNPRLKARQG
ncbi:Ribosomal protein L36 [Cryptosporangium aurantiacum]|uniref:Large ribosomal subunit protein bL36 n=1 Tax=Cryptosporangium aurantiacum TaxID=134849 RepID=A0A1M7RI61_9ACTN|nr:Ribosomal protein L36 [Cryptosporangium aurantiacum]